MKRIIAWFAENHVAANLVMLFILAAGLSSLPSINQKMFPDIEIEIITIAVPYLGAAPEEVEEGVCIRIEEEVQGVEGIDRIISNAAEGACGVTLELTPNYEVDRALADVKNAIDGITTFPEQTEKPVISHVTVRRNAVTLALSGDVGERALRVWGERIRDQILALPGITHADLMGARNYEISIEVPEESLRRHGLRFDQVVSAVQRSSMDLPGGAIRARSGEILLRAKGQAYSRQDFESIVVMTRGDGTRLLLRDVAEVVDGFEEDERRLSFNDERAVMIQVYRVGDQRLFDLTETIFEYVEDLQARLPEGLSLTIWQNQSVYLEDRLGILLRNGLTGFVLVLVLLSLFLRPRLAFWVALGVPIAVLGALWCFALFNLSINVLTLFAFILVLGLLVDDAIVIGENVHTHQERAEEPLPAAIAGAQEVTIPVIFGVLTTVAAFAPMIGAEGMMGDFFGNIGIVVVICLFFSLVESQLILPAHLGHAAGRPVTRAAPVAPAVPATSVAPSAPPRPDAAQSAQPAQGAAQNAPVEAPATLAERWASFQAFMSQSLTRLARDLYSPWLARALRWRYSVVAGAVALLMLTAAVVALGYLRFTFMPVIEGDYITASLKMPAGTPLEVTERMVQRLQHSAYTMRDEMDLRVRADDGGSIVKHVLAVSGERILGTRSPNTDYAGSGSHIGGVAIELVGSDHRPITSADVVEHWRRLTPPIAGAEELTFTSNYIDAGEPIYVQLSAPDIDELRRAADILKARISEYAGVYDIRDSWEDGKGELRLSIRPEAEPLGLALADLATQVRHAFYGAEAQRIQRGRNEVRVMVRYPESRRRSLEDLEELRIRTPEGGEAPFYAVARAERGRGYSTINRADRKRVIGVIADIDEDSANAGQVYADLTEKVLPALRAEFPGLSYTFEGEQSEYQKTTDSLLRDFGMALFVIYFLLAVPLRSYAQPLIIMSVIPFGLVGAIIGHLVRGIGFSMMSVFGVVALSGVVVNSSLVLVHHINLRRAQGMSLATAVREAGMARFRPILLTSITTAASLTPLLLEGSMGAQFLIPMAASLAFGVVFATVISLFMVPCACLILDDITRLLLRRGAAESDEAQEQEAHAQVHAAQVHARAAQEAQAQAQHAHAAQEAQVQAESGVAKAGAPAGAGSRPIPQAGG